MGAFIFTGVETVAAANLFWGTVSGWTPCTCPGSWGKVWMMVGSKPLIYSIYESKTYNRKKVISGSKVLGDYSYGGSCMMAGYPSCWPMMPPPIGTIKRIATN